MTDREKVIKALELCTSEIKTRTQTPCKTCPYHNRKYHGILGDGCCNTLPLLGDTLTLLKEQEPRVLAREEVPNAVFCWLEVKPNETLAPAIFGEENIDDTVTFATLEDGVDYLDLSDYCKLWRCWTAKPTDEQRKEEPWN